MPFRFAYICNLLDKLHHIFARHPPYLPRDVQAMSTRVITLWFKKHELKIKSEVDGLLLLSILFPDEFDERVYGLSDRDIAKVVGRAFALCTAQFEAVVSNTSPGDLRDLGDRVEQVTTQCDLLPFSRAYDISIEEIDDVLALVSAQHAPLDHQQLRLPNVPLSALNDKLGPLYRRLQARERKWLTRLILKSYAPIVMPKDLICSLYHPLLPGLLKVQFDLKAALVFIRRLEQEPAVQAAGDIDQSVGREGAVDDDAVRAPVSTSVSLVQGHSEDKPDEGTWRERGRHDRFEALASNSASQSSSHTAGRSRDHDEAAQRQLVIVTQSSPKKSSQPLSDITNTSGNKSLPNAHAAKSVITGSPASHSTRRRLSEASRNPLRSMKVSRRHNVCPKEGRRCLFYRKDVGLVPSIYNDADIAELLQKHAVVPMTLDDLTKSKVKTNMSKGRRTRRILLVDGSLGEVAEAVERIRANESHDHKGRKQWVDVYDWRLLEYIDKHGSCQDSKLECMRRYWIGTV